MNDVIKALLKQLGVAEFPGAALGLDDFTREELHGRYRRAFEDSGESQVVVGVGGFLSEVFIMDSFDQLWRNKGRFGQEGIQMVLCIPREIWEEIQPELDAELVHDLTKVEETV